ncbi:protein of unknown function [Micromonospora chokoriensis]|uniref:DUF4145 domain-containing protein n=1 Tax=Micromonospora chokoriensis TaxID=356851 RepID=A0A1C4XNM5_9ACTN|nr:protein of unknown function [Micromonospora chokoriensis]
MNSVETARSREMHDHEAWEPDFIRGFFQVVLVCGGAECGEVVLASGEMTVGPVVSSSHDWTYSEFYLMRHLMPALVPIAFPERTPNPVKDRVLEASRLLYFDASAAGNRIRTAVEELLTHQKVPRTTSSSGKRRRLTAHHRIDRFRAKNSEAANLLEAVKWIGNDASHEVALSPLEVIDGLELLEGALQLIYNDKTQRLTNLAKRINLRKTSVKPKPRSGRP